MIVLEVLQYCKQDMDLLLRLFIAYKIILD